MGLDYILCGHCGTITREVRWVYLQRDLETGELREHQPDESDPIMRCPICLYDHVDDDGDPGVWDGDEESLEKQREELTRDNPNYITWWIDALTDLIKMAKTVTGGVTQ